MVKLEKVQAALRRAGMHNRFWGKPEMRALQNILMDDEEVVAAVNGRYEGGWAMLLATDRRLLLVDKKMMFLNLEDIRYDMISQVEYCARLLDASVSIQTINSKLRFRSWKQNNLRQLTSFMQERVMELRHMYKQQEAEQAPPSVYGALPYYQGSTQVSDQPAPAPSQTFGQRMPKPYHTNAPLSVRRRISRFYPLND